MAEGSLARRLSAQDAAFLYFEKQASPMHIGSIAVFDGDIDYSLFVNNIAAKLHLIPRYLQRVVPAPFNLGHPTWEWDPDFDITRHIKHLRIDGPGSDAQLMDLAGELFAGVLDRNKPLWEMYLVEGLEGARTALVSKVHHCLVDGVSGIELLMVVLDVSPSPAPAPPPPEARPREPIPSPMNRLFDAIFDNISVEFDRLAELQKNTAEALLGGESRARTISYAVETALPYFASPGARAPFNKPLTPKRKLACSEFSFAEIRAIRQTAGGTVNDVVLAVLGGALGRYLEMHGENTDGRTMRILTPVNVRREPPIARAWTPSATSQTVGLALPSSLS